MKQGHAQHRSIGEQLERVDAVVERVSTLDADERRVVACSSSGTELRGSPNVPDSGRLSQEGSKHAEILLEGTSAAPGGPGRIGRNHPSRAAKTDLPRRREIGMPEKESTEDPTPMRAVQVVAEDPTPDEGLDVQVDRIGAAKEVDGFLADTELLGNAARFHGNASLTRPRGDRLHPGASVEEPRISHL